MATIDVSIPMALQLVIEDVGWWEKSHPVGPNSPFRTGLKRRHHPSDYLALVHLAKRLNMRPLIPFVACEWDRTNLLKKVPTATWMGADWDNRWNVGPWLDQAAQVLNYVTTNLAKAKMIRPRQHALMAWETGVLIIERGIAPVPWHVIAVRPQFAFDRPVLSLHWANLLDEDFQNNLDVVDHQA